MRRSIIQAEAPEALTLIRQLFAEYAASLEIDLAFQGFDEELADLPGAYARPAGSLLLGFDGEEPAGCVAFRRLVPAIAELKRLYVRPAARGAGWGRRLAERAADEARASGYGRIRLDSLPSMRAAIDLYLGMGFREIPAYRHNPVAGTRFLELDLRPGRG